MLVPRRRRFEITERIDAQGEVVTGLDETEIDALVESVRTLGDVQAVAVCLMFSFLNDVHERRIGERLRAALPDLPVFLSSEVLPEIREFERASTTAVCAYVGPVLTSYLERLAAALAELDLPALHVMGSNGGVLDVVEALRMPAAAVESGPAAGVIAAQRLGDQIGRANLISFDMGGTTAKASLIENGRIETTSEYEVGGQGNVGRWLHGTGHPIRVPVIDLAEVSAGGGSIAWIDPGGALRVGPASAGAEPGPACYGRGGDRPTVTDANVVLGRLSRTHLLGGRLPIDAAAAETAVRTHVADPLGLGVMEAAAGIVSVVNHGMAEALRIVSVERGHDAREFSLVAFGGAGPVHAAALAEELDIPEVVIPPIPGGFSALGLVATDLRRDWSTRSTARSSRSIRRRSTSGSRSSNARRRPCSAMRGSRNRTASSNAPRTAATPSRRTNSRFHSPVVPSPASRWTHSPASSTPSTFGPTVTRIRANRSRWSTCGSPRLGGCPASSFAGERWRRVATRRPGTVRRQAVARRRTTV